MAPMDRRRRSVYLQRMELRHLRYYVAVAEECHFGRAAARLHIAQPHLSQQIKVLEGELGVQLLARSTRMVEVSAAGRDFLAQARLILEAVDHAGQRAVRVAAGEVGHLTVGFTGSATYELLPALARVLRSESPDLGLDLRGEMLTAAQVDGLRKHTLDVGILRPPVRESGLDVKTLRREPLIAVLPRDHRLAAGSSVRLTDLRNEPFITYPSHDRSVVYEAVLNTCQRAGFNPVIGQEVSETSTLVVLVAAGRGVALVPASVQHLNVTGAVYSPLTGATAEVELAVATRQNDDSPHVRRLLARLRTLDDSFIRGASIRKTT